MRLFLHIGHGKTGSSFIQSWIACNSKVLYNNHRILVPGIQKKASLGFFSKGNQVELESFLRSNSPMNWLENELPESNTEINICESVLFSFEGLVRKFEVFADPVLRIANLLDIEMVELLLYVRDPLEHACSVYNQMVKRHGYSGSLDQWLNIYNFPHHLLSCLEKISSNRLNFKLHVEHYKNCSSDVIQPLLYWLEINSSDLTWSKPPARKVNRSLTLDELKLMQLVNRKVGKSAVQIGENLVNRLPDLDGAKLIPSKEAIEDFKYRWEATIASINNYLPSHAHLLLNSPELSTQLPLNFSEKLCILPEQLNCIIDGLIACDNL